MISLLKIKQSFALDNNLFYQIESDYKKLEKDLSESGFKIIKFWFYAQSIGELKLALSISNLIHNILSSNSNPKNKIIKPLFFISIDTMSAYRTLEKIPQSEAKFYFFFHPYSFLSFFSIAYINCIKPDYFISIEHLVSKNLINNLSKVNAKLCFLGLDFNKERVLTKFKAIINSIDINILKNICVSVNNLEKKESLLKEFNDNPCSISVLPDPLKLSLSEYKPHNKIKNKVERESDDCIIIAFVSMHKKESRFFLNLLPSVKKNLTDFKKLKFIFAPRNIKTFGLIKRKALRSGFKPAYFKNGGISIEDFAQRENNLNLLIIDDYGVLESVYEYSDIVYVGKSLFKSERGGHNIIEPIAYAKAVVTGPFTDNFKDITDIFLKNKDIIVFNRKEFKNRFADFIKNEDLWKNIGSNACNLYQDIKKKAEKNLIYFLNNELLNKK